MKLVGTNTVELHLPRSMRIHPVINVSRIKPYRERLPGQPVTAPGPSNVTEDREEEYEVERIIDSRYKGKRLEYLVQWTSWSKTDWTWEPVSNLGNAADAVRTSTPPILPPLAICAAFRLLTSFSYSDMSDCRLLSLRLRPLIAWKSILRRGAVLHTLCPPWYSFSFFCSYP